MRCGLRCVLLVAAAGLTLVGCGSADGISEATQVSPFAEIDLPAGPVVAELAIGDVGYRLFDEGDGCVALLIEGAGLRPAVERSCSSAERGAIVLFSDPCGWFASTDPTQEYDLCDVEVPQVIHGVVSDPDVGFVCMARDRGAVPVRLLPLEQGRFIFAPVLGGQIRAPFLFTVDGERHNEAVFDVDQSWFFECEQLPGLFELTDTIYVYPLEIVIEIAEELRREDVTVGLTGVHGEIRVTGVSDGSTLPAVTVQIREDSRGLDVYLVDTATGTTYLDSAHLWSDDVRDVLRSEGACSEPIRVLVSIDPSVLDGNQDSVRTSLLEANCG